MDQISAAIAGILTTVNAVGQVLWNEGATVAKGIAALILTAELTFSGFRIMLGGATITQSLWDIFRKLVLILILLFFMWPQKILMQARKGLTDAGRELGHQITLMCPSLEGAAGGAAPITGHDPPEYWLQWLRATGLDDGGRGNRFGPKWVTTRMIPLVISGSKGGQIVLYDRVMESLKGACSSLVNVVDHLTWDPRQWLSGFKGLVDVVYHLPGILLALRYLGQMLAGYLIGTTLIVGVGFFATLIMLGAMIGPTMGFYLVLGFGTATIPLLLFKSTEGIWRNYLQFLLACTMAPFFYYVMSAIGLVMVDSIIHYLFTGAGAGAGVMPAGATGAGPLGNMIGAIIMDSLADIHPALSEIVKVLLDVGTGKVGPVPVGAAIPPVIDWPVFLGGWYGGMAILALFCTIGVGVGATSIPIAFSWNQAFASDRVIGAIADRLMPLQGASMTVLGLVAAGAIRGGQQGFSFLAGLIRRP